MISEKYCHACTSSKAVSEFHKSVRTKDGLATQCRSCSNVSKRKWYERNKEAKCAQTTAWRAANRERFNKTTLTWQRTNGWMSALVTKVRTRAKKCGYDFDLDIEWIEGLWARQQGRCFWYQIDMLPADERRNPLQPSLDRLDCNRGYTKDNVVLACAAANMGRSDAHPDVFWGFAQKLADNFRRPIEPPKT